MHYEFVVIEHYPDGGVWKHYFRTLREAQWAVEDMQVWHKGRKYVVEPMPVSAVS